MVNPFESDFVTVVGAVAAVGFKPAVEVIGRKLRGGLSDHFFCAAPGSAIAFAVDDDVGIAVEDADGAMGGGKGEELGPGADFAEALVGHSGAEFARDGHVVTNGPA